MCPTAIFIFNQGNKLPILARLLGCGFVRGVFLIWKKFDFFRKAEFNSCFTQATDDRRYEFRKAVRGDVAFAVREGFGRPSS
jgi:hypothetical protein